MHRVIIDTDPGQDDAFALLLALASPDIEVLGVTTVAGNVPVAQTAENARRIVELAGCPATPVFRGADRPLLRAARPAGEIHGETGINGWDWAPPQKGIEPRHAVDFIIETLLREPAGSVTLIAIAPQTNLALALRREPAIAARIAKIVFMGGGFFAGGNMTPAAEYNILVDPEAAAIVLGAGIDVAAVPIDCTHDATAPLGWSAELEALGTEVGRACGGMMRFFEQHGIKKYGTPTRPLHDAIAVGALIWPELFEGRRCPVRIECAGTFTTGMTVVDWWRQTGEADNCLWLRRCLDPTELYRRIHAELSRLPAGSWGARDQLL